jgi:hypothetical protein
LENHKPVLIFFLQPRPPLFSLRPTAAALTGHVPRTRRPRAALSRATCPLTPCPPVPRPHAGFPWPLHVAPPPPASPAPVRLCSTPLSFKTCIEASSRPRLPTRTLYFAGHPFPRAQLFTEAPPQPVLTVVSCPHRLSPPIQCSRSTTMTHYSSLTHPISFPYTRAASSTAPASSKLRRLSASPSTSCYKAPQPQPRAPIAPHHAVEAS